MKRIGQLGFFLILAALLYSCGPVTEEGNGKEQYFQGIVTYAITYEGATPIVTAARTQMGDQSRFCFYEGNYYQDFSGKQLEYYLYLADPNLYYIKLQTQDTVSLMDCNREMASHHDIHEILTKKVHERVLGKDCQVVSASFKDNLSSLREIDFYFNPDFMPINPAWEAHNPVYNYAAVFGRMKALPLKMLFDYGELKVIFTATAIDQQQLAGFFEETAKKTQQAPKRDLN